MHLMLLAFQCTSSMNKHILLLYIRLHRYSNVHILPAHAARGQHCSPLLNVSNLTPDLRSNVETEIMKESGDNDLMGMEWMDKGDTWVPQKIAPMPGKILGAEPDAFNHRGPINTWSQIDNLGH